MYFDFDLTLKKNSDVYLPCNTKTIASVFWPENFL